MIKKIFTLTMIILLFTLALATIYNFKNAILSSEYSKQGIILNNNIIKDNNGCLWRCKTDYKQGSKVIITFNNNNTSDITDDIIVNITQ